MKPDPSTVQTTKTKRPPTQKALDKKTREEVVKKVVAKIRAKTARIEVLIAEAQVLAKSIDTVYQYELRDTQDSSEDWACSF